MTRDRLDRLQRAILCFGIGSGLFLATSLTGELAFALLAGATP